MASEDGAGFVRWREEFVSQERGSRVVHYYLEDAVGASHLAVVGTERSLRHMLYVVSDDFCRVQGCGGSDVGSGLFARKWRSRREVVDWLASFLPAKTVAAKFPKFGNRSGDDTGLVGFNETGGYVCHNLGKACSSDIVWSGSFWTCGKLLRHYQAFCRNGTTISTHSFVLVMSEEENRYLAYLEDMYEDKKGQKKVKVRWFHQNKEFACTIPPPPPHPCEVFITPYSQVISVECVDDIATVLTPEHYEKCSTALPSSSLVGIRFCFRQYNKNKFKHFDLRTLRGYFSQAAVLSLKILPVQEKDGSDFIKIVKHDAPGKIQISKQLERFYSKCLGTKICQGPPSNSIPSYENQSDKQSPISNLSMTFQGPQNQLTPAYNAGDIIELLSQDSGIRGCWFKCTVVKSCKKKLKVRYEDIQDVDDDGKLEEWVSIRLAAPDKLGLRCPDRFTTRPLPPQNSLIDSVALLPGSAVDAWRHNGWWEGVVVSSDSSVIDSQQVYFPGENILEVCQLKKVRISKDWVNNHWVDVETKSDILSSISLVDARTRRSAYVASNGGPDSGSSAMSNQEPAAMKSNSNGDKQTEADKQAKTSLTDRTYPFAEDEKQTILGKHPMGDNSGQDHDVEVGVDVASRLISVARYKDCKLRITVLSDI